MSLTGDITVDQYAFDAFADSWLEDKWFMDEMTDSTTHPLMAINANTGLPASNVPPSLRRFVRHLCKKKNGLETKRLEQISACRPCQTDSVARLIPSAMCLMKDSNNNPLRTNLLSVLHEPNPDRLNFQSLQDTLGGQSTWLHAPWRPS